MTALHAAGGGLPLAFRIPHVVEQIGSLAGFAAVAGLAILSALYFSQARDLRRLREWAGRAPERAAEQAASGAQVVAPVPGRVAAVPQRQAQAVQPAQPKDGEEAKKAEDAKDGEQPKVGEQAAAPEPGKPAPETTGAGANGDQAPQPASTPGMPAPASAAAAAAGAPAASSAAPAGAPPKPAPGPPQSPAQVPPKSPPPPAPSPAAGEAAKPAPAPPTSVLPPRTGSVPPVRRVGGTLETSRPLDATPPRPSRNPVYATLAVVGVIVLGAGAAIGVPKLVGGDDGSPKSASKKKEKAAAKTASTVSPAAARRITVAVLNGTSVPGLAAQIGDQVENHGFTLGTVSNATEHQRATSVAMYSAGHQRDARAVARKLRISSVEPVDANSQAIAGDATVVVVVGSDQTN